MVEAAPVPEVKSDTKAEDKVSVINVNFKDGTIIDTVKFDGEGGIPKLLRELAKVAKKTNVKSVVVMTIDENNHVDWIHVTDSEYHLTLATICIDDLKEDLKASIFGSEEDEE